MSSGVVSVRVSSVICNLCHQEIEGDLGVHVTRYHAKQLRETETEHEPKTLGWQQV